MKRWTVKGYIGSDYVISGNTLPDAIKENIKAIARDNADHVGNAAGYRIVGMEAEYREGILGGKGGVELVIKTKGLDLAHKPASDEVKTAVVWIYAVPDDLPEPHDFLRPANGDRAG